MYSEKQMKSLAEEFNSHNDGLFNILQEELAILLQDIKRVNKTKPDEEEPPAIIGLRNCAEKYLENVKEESVRDRNKMKVKLTDIKRFMLSHLSNI